MNYTNGLTMHTPILNPTVDNVLRQFANKLWNNMMNQDDNVENIKELYYSSVNNLLGEKPKNDNNKKKKKPSIPVPFYGHVETDWCCGVKKNHGLYTQCMKPKPNNCDYCKVCARQSMNNANGKPNCGDIRDRVKQWSDNLDYKPPGMKREIPYANVVSKLNIDITVAQTIVESLGWQPIPNCHLTEKKAKRGRPKTKIVVEDSDDETPKKRGRPRKQKKKELTNDELIAQFLQSCN
jgi:hypothetical protein